MKKSKGFKFILKNRRINLNPKRNLSPDYLLDNLFIYFNLLLTLRHY